MERLNRINEDGWRIPNHLYPIYGKYEASINTLVENIPPHVLLDFIQNKAAQLKKDTLKKYSPSKNDLTPREIDVLRLLALGKTYSMIAEKLFIDKETVRTHIKNIYTKLEAHSKSEAIGKALDAGIIKEFGY